MKPKSPKLLLMHADPDAGPRLASILESCGWTVFQTISPSVAMDIAKRRAPDLILIDVSTPGMDGERLAHLFRAEALTCTIPALSVSDAERVNGVREAWAVDTISMNTRQPILVAKLKNALRQRVKRPYILIVDDEADLVDVLSESLTGAGYVVSGASNGMEALEVIRSVHPDVIVLDLDMPLLNGWDFLHQARAGRGLASSKVIILTGVDQSLEDRQQGLKLGACDYLLKPCDPKEVDRAIEAALMPPEKEE